MPETEADTCRKYVLPKIYAAGWTDDQISEQKTFTDGRIIVAGTRVRRRPQKRADYLLRFTRDFPIGIIEAKAKYKTAGDGLQQAKDYAEILDLKFAFATNGREIIEFDFLTGQERLIDAFPSPAELWERLRAGQGIADDRTAEQLLTPCFQHVGKTLRYYQEVAIRRAVQAVLAGNDRILITMATGTGKTDVGFQISWKLWNARWKIENGQISLGREMYFSIYQAIAQDERRPGLYREYPPDFFDLIIIDECHRGSARDESSWREILEYYCYAHQMGMTATPLRKENRDTYRYFGNPLYTYSLRQGIDDGFLAPYRVHRVVTDYDAAGWRPSKGELDRYGREIPDEEYQTKDFERVVALRARTKAIARHVTEFLKKTDRFAKTIIFCVDQEHADEMRRELSNLSSDLVQQHPDYVCRVTADEGDVGRGHLSRFQDVETDSPVILTTSQLLTTGVDAPTCKNVVLARVINSMVEFKQIIGRGTRLRDDYGKLFFTILDFTQSTRLFADPEFDGDPVRIDETEIDAEGNEKETGEAADEQPEDWDAFPDDGPVGNAGSDDDEGDGERRKYYVDGGHVEIAAHMVYEIDPDGHQLRMVKYTDYTAEKVRTLYPNARALRERWASPDNRGEIIEALAERGIDFEQRVEFPASPTRTRSTCSATSRSTPRCGHGGNVPSGCGPRRRTSSRSSARRPGRS